VKCADCENEVDLEASDVCSACEETRLVAARDHEIAALKRSIENGRAAHNEDRVARDWLARDRDTWRARAEKAEADLRDANEWRDKLADKIIELEAATSRGRELVDDANERADQAEAQAAAMRDRLGAILSLWPYVNCVCGRNKARLPTRAAENARALLAGDAGRTLLAELEALRALDAMLRGTWTAKERVAALAAVEAARKG
jgi:DNA repair exonuclease SbcCD ATPase subunit